MTATLVDTDDVAAALLRPLTDSELIYVPRLCDQAEAKLRAVLRTLDTRIAAFERDSTDPTGIDPELAAAVLAGIIKRVLVNPKGLWSKSEAVGPYSQSETYLASRAAGSQTNVESLGGLEVTASDIAQLCPAPLVAPMNIRISQPRVRPH